MALREGKTSIQSHGGQTTEQVLLMPPLKQSVRMPVLLYNQSAAGTALTNTTTETLIGSYSVPASTFFDGCRVKVSFAGIATATNSSDTLTIKLYIGGLSGTALLTSSATNASDNDVFGGEYYMTLRTSGASGTHVGHGRFTKVEAATGVATEVFAKIESTAIDTTTAQVVGVGATWSVASASNSCRLDELCIELA